MKICLRLCKIDSSGQRCEACQRTLDEIKKAGEEHRKAQQERAILQEMWHLID